MCFGRLLNFFFSNINFFRILLNFELKLEIPNIMLVCKFEINWSTNKHLRALTTYLGRTDGRTNGRTSDISISPLHFAGAGDNKCEDKLYLNRH